jgi:hypothetical protein
MVTQNTVTQNPVQKSSDRTSKHDTIANFTPAMVEQLAIRLEADNYNSPFESLEDWHLLRTIAWQRPELADPYVYLLDFEAYDEA